MEIKLQDLEFIEPLLREMALETEAAFGVRFIVTSLYRIGDGGVHGQLPLRGLDWRCRHAGLGNLVAAYVNARWQYDSARPDKVCCMAHAVRHGSYHLHLQVHANTVRI